MRGGSCPFLVRTMLVTAASLLLCSVEAVAAENDSSVSRDDFPPGFIFGAGTSAYQVEGAVAEDGRTPSIWDTFTHAGRMEDESTGDVAADGYHKYKEDVKLMADTGLDSYRFSISWSRLLPNGRGTVNPKGLQFYNNLIDELQKFGIQAHVTIYHLDLPQILEDEYAGWLNPKIVDDFTAYANVCFREFGDRVSRWTTIAEPNIIGIAGYDNGIWPPNRCSPPFGNINCTLGNSTTEPYIAVHNLLLAHASAVKLYRKKYQAVQKGQIGLNLFTYWCYPLSNSVEDIRAQQRLLDFNMGWLLNPLVFGDYPRVMKKNAGSRLPSFIYVKDNVNASKLNLRDYNADTSILILKSKNDTPSGQYNPNVPALVDPPGLQYLLEYLRDAYENPPVFIEENGYGVLRSEDDQFNDTRRVDFLSVHIASTLDAVRNGANVKGFFVWSFMDVFEFLGGYQSRCGLFYVNFEDQERERKPKLSAHWYSKFLAKLKMNESELVAEEFHPQLL